MITAQNWRQALTFGIITSYLSIRISCKGCSTLVLTTATASLETLASHMHNTQIMIDLPLLPGLDSTYPDNSQPRSCAARPAVFRQASSQWGSWHCPMAASARAAGRGASAKWHSGAALGGSPSFALTNEVTSKCTRRCAIPA